MTGSTPALWSSSLHGGLNIADPEQDGPTIIASASVEAFLDVEAGDWQISEKENG